MNLNQISLIAYIGRDAESKALKNGTMVVNFSVATNSSWKDATTGEYKEKTQWHNIVCYGDGFAKLAPRLLKGTLVFVQGELQTREYERTIEIKNGKKAFEQKIKQIAVEVNARTIRLLERSKANDDAEPTNEAQEGYE